MTKDIDVESTTEARQDGGPAPYVEPESGFVADRSGVVEAVQEVLPTQSEASAALEAPESSPTVKVSARVLAAEGYPVPTTAEIGALFDRWNAALQSGDAEQVVALYIPDSVLLSFNSSTLCQSVDEKLDFYNLLLAQRPWAACVESQIHRGHGTAVDSGRCTLHLVETDEYLHGSYTFTYVWDGSTWLISSHHLSAQPVTDSAAPDGADAPESDSEDQPAAVSADTTNAAADAPESAGDEDTEDTTSPHSDGS